eukprot:CAMPEP_0206331384 /NCGR_PEP_ID=MMETSP0106_2-20121207/24219_1 /ASSEMBLY_ACC=CAM_ASM_000206 /TAXON_ID=81532 /ORGANISM="Acanthoeca-like sp., Strain 10tr" /LENGTH=70 /DNA_ID=CAMNT_0053764197 /DNA_START=104 /DNA_END=316 /DNA_ORIENTATION=+
MLSGALIYPTIVVFRRHELASNGGRDARLVGCRGGVGAEFDQPDRGLGSRWKPGALVGGALRDRYSPSAG